MANTFALTWTNSPVFQTLDSQLVASAAGEDVGFSFTPDTGTTNVSTWAIQFDMAPSSGRNPILTIASGSITKGITGTITFSVPKADTEAFPTRAYYWELIRTDAGNRKVLAYGSWDMTGSPSLYPGVTIPPTIIPLNKGGTGSDLSATGPAVIVQAAAAANMSALAADLSNTTLYLRKDLTWQLPTGSVPGTVTNVSVVTANGVSGTVATSTTTPAITITLGAITPTSVNGNTLTTGSGTLTLSTFTLTVTGTASVSGTNTGDQTNISGNAATVSVIDAGSDSTTWPLVATSQTGNLSPATNANLTFNAATGELSASVLTTATNVNLASTGAIVFGSNVVLTASTGVLTVGTGVLKGATATPGDNTTQMATTAFVTAAVAAVSITVANEATDTTCFPIFNTAATGTFAPKSNAALTFNSATANLGCTTFTGALVGNASTASAVAVGGITGLGTGVATALAVNVGSAGAFVTFNGALGTPSSGVGTNLTGTAAGLTAGNVTTNANLTGPITSIGNATSIASQTGTGTKFAVDDSPTFIGTPAAPTAAPGTNTTQIATTAFVAAAVTAGVPTTITVANEASDTTCFPAFFTAATGDLGPKTNAALTFNSSTVNLACTTFTGALVGNATTATTASAVAVGGITGLGTGVATALAVNVGSAGAFVTFNGAGGTPSSLTLTNATGLPTIVAANEATDTTCFPVFFTAATGELGPKTNASLTFNSSTANLACTTFTGALVGNASTASAVAVGGITGLGTGVATALAVNVGSAGAFVTFNGALGTPSSGTLTNCTFPTLNQNTSGSAASLSIAGQTGLMTVTGLVSTNRIKTVRDAADTILELGGSYTPTGTWTSITLVTPALGTPASGVVTNLTGTASININGTVGATTPAAGTFTTLVVGSTTSLLLGTAGSAVGNIGFRNATSGTITLAPPTGALGTVTITLPSATGTLLYSGGPGGTPSSITLTNGTGLPTVVVADESSDTTCFLGFVTAASGELGLKTNANLTINSNSGKTRLQFGTLTDSSTASPETISLGASRSNTAASNPKFRIYDDGTNLEGFGFSAGQLEYIVDVTTSHVFYANGVVMLSIKPTGSVVMGSAAIATNATGGFWYITSCAGTPSGTPTGFTGRTPMVYDSTNDILYIYNSGWKKAVANIVTGAITWQ